MTWILVCMHFMTFGTLIYPIEAVFSVVGLLLGRQSFYGLWLPICMEEKAKAEKKTHF